MDTTTKNTTAFPFEGFIELPCFVLNGTEPATVGFLVMLGEEELYIFLKYDRKTHDTVVLSITHGKAEWRNLRVEIGFRYPYATLSIGPRLSLNAARISDMAIESAENVCICATDDVGHEKIIHLFSLHEAGKNLAVQLREQNRGQEIREEVKAWLKCIKCLVVHHSKQGGRTVDHPEEEVGPFIA